MWLKYMSNTKQERHSRQNGNNNNDNNNNNNNKTIFLPIYAKYHKWAIQDLHQQWKEIGTRWKQNTELSMSKQDPSHLEHSNNVYVPLLIDSSDIKGQKQYQQNNDFINKQSKLFDELRGNRITIMDHHESTPTKEDRKVLDASIWKQKRVQ